MARHKYGYVQDPKDERDFVFVAPQKAEQLPTQVDLRQFCSPVRDQGNLGSCTGFSMATGLREYMLIKNTPVPPVPPTPPTCLEQLVGKTLIRKLLGELITLSPLYLYYHERELEGTIDWDAGAYMRDGMKVLNQRGVCSEKGWPYLISQFRNDPTEPPNDTEAITFKISYYARLYDLMGIKSALAIGQGVVFGFNVYESFDSDEVANSGIMPMPKMGERILGGHAVFICGYMDGASGDDGYLIIKNSWGSGWGKDGYFFMPYAFVTPNDVQDIWTASS